MRGKFHWADAFDVKLFKDMDECAKFSFSVNSGWGSGLQKKGIVGYKTENLKCA